MGAGAERRSREENAPSGHVHGALYQEANALVLEGALRRDDDEALNLLLRYPVSHPASVLGPHPWTIDAVAPP